MILIGIFFVAQEHIVKTGRGSVSVSVFGDQDKPALITYPDLALNCKGTEISALNLPMLKHFIGSFLKYFRFRDTHKHVYF